MGAATHACDSLTPMADPHFIEWARAHQDGALIQGALLEPTMPHDYVGAALVIRAALFFPNAADPAVRNTIAQCFDDYAALAGEHLKWLWQDGKREIALKNGKVDSNIFTGGKPDEGFGVYITSGQKAIDASFWEFRVSGLSRRQEQHPDYGTNALTFSMPLLYVAEHPVAFQQLFVAFARRLNVSSGYAGYATNLSYAQPEANAPTEYWLSTRFAGLDVGDPIQHALHLRDRLKTVSWLTAIDKAMLEKVGGVAALRNELPRDWFAFYDLNGGIVIQAGPRPESGASTEEKGAPVLPANYVLVNHALQDIRVDTLWQLQIGLGGTSAAFYKSAASGDRWLRRYDVPMDQRLAYKAALLELPVLTPEIVLADRL
ncbi:type VI immunity family protein [Burkholderia ubonensis]|uniref:type VI immunity family protein n=1 Tax=Burkholderia ubonensis TaxID=101571 RepID=UPI002FCC15C0